MEFVVYTDAKREGRWRLVGRNGKVLADSGEGYTRRRDAVRAVRTILKGAGQLSAAKVTVTDEPVAPVAKSALAAVRAPESKANARTLIGLATLVGA